MEPSLNPALNHAAAFGPRLAAYPGKWFGSAANLAFRKRAELVALVDGGGGTGLGGDELEFRAGTLRVGFLLGWIAIAVVLVGALSSAGRHQRGLLVAMTVGAAVANAGWMRVPWREWLGRRRGQVLLNLWSAGLLAYVGALVVVGGSTFALLLFLATPFLVVVQAAGRRVLWLLATAGTCVLVTVVGQLPVAMSAMRFGLVLAIVGAAVALERAVRREARARAAAAAHAEVERARFIDSDHRVKNSLQTVADLLLLEQPEGESAAAFEQSASRIRSIAAVHRLLSETGDARVRIDELLELIVASDPRGIALAADPVILDPSAAQRLGLVANELITNARKHGELPISVRLEQDDRGVRLSVEDAGRSRPARFDGGLGLDLVRRLVEQGLGGQLVLASLPRGGVSPKRRSEHPMRILIAEDDPIIGLALAQRVRALGHEPIGPVSDGAQAVATAENTLPDLYLFDIELPVLDGLGAASELAARGLRRPVVVVTGVEDPALVERAIGSGVGAYLTKPIDSRELDAAIRLAATRHRELEALEAEVAQAKEALEHRKVVERAKGLLMATLGLTEPEAFARMQLAARRRNLKLVAIAAQIIEQRSVLEGDALKRKRTTGPPTASPSARSQP